MKHNDFLLLTVMFVGKCTPEAANDTINNLSVINFIST
jgi:hypothetical protein